MPVLSSSPLSEVNTYASEGLQLGSEPAADASLIDQLLLAQQEITVVQRFAQRHEHVTQPLLQEHYHDLIPLSAPQADEQYAFEVDLDSCTGCKACVSACHNLNGLEADELWRKVGLLHGGSPELPMLQTVTTACHHCLEPACLHGCPVLAYEKDDLTGIVRHLDDQCIGCQYCILKCPYDVPVYSPSKGIVRKCDMCHDRLAAGEAPACVQSCPNEAIRIRTVSRDTILDQCEADQFLPGAPGPAYTMPTTMYKTSRPLPRNLLPADYYSARKGHPHWALVIMLVLTQMSVGAFVIDQWLLSMPGMNQALHEAVRPVHRIAALLLGLLGMGAAVFHLGRPHLAYRAMLGLKTSWLSREILAFTLFAMLTTCYSACGLVPWLGNSFSKFSELVPRASHFLGSLASLTGIMAIGCSVMIYVDTRRPFWNAFQTSVKFFLTALVLGIPTVLFISTIATLWVGHGTIRPWADQLAVVLCQWLLMVIMAKLCFESLIFFHLRDKQNTPLRRTAQLLTGELSMMACKRLFVGVMGGVVLPWILLSEGSLASEGQFHPVFYGAVVAIMTLLLLVGELLERTLFFTASVAFKMPGGPAT